MNANNNASIYSESQNDVDYCTTSFNVSGQEIVNNYRCDQKPFSPADMWNIQRNSKQPSIRTGNTQIL